MPTAKIAYWKEVFLEFDGCCAYCGKNLLSSAKIFRFSTVDHVYPSTYGGVNEPSNLAPCCHECNGVKSKLLPEEIQLPEAKWIDRSQRGVSIKPQSKRQYCAQVYRRYIHPSLTKYALKEYRDYLAWHATQKAVSVKV